MDLIIDDYFWCAPLASVSPSPATAAWLELGLLVLPLDRDARVGASAGFETLEELQATETRSWD